MKENEQIQDMATRKLMLNKARRLNDGSYPLVLQLLHLRRKRVIYSGIYLYPGEYNPRQQKVVLCKSKYRMLKEIRAMNRTLHELKDRIDTIIALLEQSGKAYTCDDIAERYLLVERGGSLSSYWQNYISELRQCGRLGMAQAQQYTLNSVLSFLGSEQLMFPQVTAEFILQYERHLHGRNLAPNTVCYYMRNFRTVMNHAEKSGIVKKSGDSVFEGISTRPRKTMKRALTRETLRSLTLLEYRDNRDLALAHDLFLFSFYTRGMAFVDVAFLRKENIAGNLIYYHRRKTGQQIQISINDQIKTIITKYANVSQYIFPIVTSEHPETAYREYRSALRQINKSLKIIGNQIGLPIPLTTYVARHSWATQAKEHGFPVAVISEGLGHTSENITRIYLKEFDQSVLDSANEVIARL